MYFKILKKLTNSCNFKRWSNASDLATKDSLKLCPVDVEPTFWQVAANKCNGELLLLLEMEAVMIFWVWFSFNSSLVSPDISSWLRDMASMVNHDVVSQEGGLLEQFQRRNTHKFGNTRLCPTFLALLCKTKIRCRPAPRQGPAYKKHQIMVWQKLYGIILIPFWIWFKIQVKSYSNTDFKIIKLFVNHGTICCD